MLVSRCFEVARVYTARVLGTYTRLEGEADLAGDVREGVAGDVAGDLAGEVGECLAGEVGGSVAGDVAGDLAGEVGEGDGGQKCQISAATCASSPPSTPHLTTSARFLPNSRLVHTTAKLPSYSTIFGLVHLADSPSNCKTSLIA